MKFAIRTLVLWFLLAALAWMFASTGQDVLTMPLAFGGTRIHAGFGSWATLGVATAMIPALCMWLTITAVLLLPKHWPGRLIFWMGTVAAWFAVAVLMQGRAETDHAGKVAVIFGAVVTGLTAVWLLCKVRPFPAWRVLGEIATAAILWGAIGYLVLTTYEAKTRSLRARAEARWTEIGLLPIAEFEKTLVAGRENDGSEVLRQILRERVNTRFYKNGTRLAELEPAIEQTEETKNRLNDVATFAALLPADDVDPSAQSVVTIDLPTASLDADYRRILAAEPPVWAGDPHDGYSISAPNFLGIRQFAQLIAADATRRFAAGDQEGAARALSAGLRIGAGLRNEPTLVSLMIDIAVEAMMASKQVRLPAAEGALQIAAKDAVDLRAEFLKRLQLEGWVNLRFADQMSEQEVKSSVLPRWLARIACRAQIRRQMTMAVLNGAEHAAIQKDPATLALPDLGVSRHNAVSDALPSSMEFNVNRAMMRMTATLLLREQVELIRLARASLTTGTPMEPYQSAAVPMAHWELTIDKEKATVSTRLVGAPEWIMKNEVTGPEFWCLPLDGSGAWRFHRPEHSASGE